VLFGDPQLALTAVGRVLEISREEVRAVAAQRLRPDNRAVLVYEPVEAGEHEEDGESAAQDANAAHVENDNEETGQ
jgi:hypothetical protein